jgi:transcription antitermination factor NusG
VNEEMGMLKIVENEGLGAVVYQIGETYPLDGRRGIIGAKLEEPVWHALVVLPMRERAATEMLKQKGVHAFFPQREKRYHQRGRTFTRKLPIVTQIVYAKFWHQPNWDVMQRQKLITGVFSRNGRPIRIPSDIIRQVRGMQVEEEKLEEARHRLFEFHPGDRAEITAGPLSGFLVDVTRVAQGRVWFESMSGVKGETSAENLEPSQRDETKELPQTRRFGK